MKTLCAPIFVLALGLLLCASVYAGLRLGADSISASDNWSDGQAARLLEGEYKEALPFRFAARALWGSIAYGLFRSGHEGVVIGKDGWLYTDEEFRWPPDAVDILTANREAIQSVEAWLRARGIALQVALLPAKASIYQQHLADKGRPELWRELYGEQLVWLRQQDIDAPDLQALFKQQSERQPLFVKHDTHWTPYGAKVAAEAIGASWQNSDTLHHQAFVTTKTDAQPHEGDLLDFVQTGWLQDWFFAPESWPRYETAAQGTTASLFDAPPVEVVLAGTSYSAREEWHFAGFLKQALQADLLNMADAGQGPMQPMAALIRQIEQMPDMKLVIWEIPERYLLQRDAQALSDIRTLTEGH